MPAPNPSSAFVAVGALIRADLAPPIHAAGPTRPFFRISRFLTIDVLLRTNFFFNGSRGFVKIHVSLTWETFMQTLAPFQ